MDPLIIAGHGRKLVDARLINGEPIAGPQIGADERLKLRPNLDTFAAASAFPP